MKGNEVPSLIVKSWITEAEPRPKPSASGIRVRANGRWTVYPPVLRFTDATLKNTAIHLLYPRRIGRVNHSNVKSLLKALHNSNSMLIESGTSRSQALDSTLEPLCLHQILVIFFPQIIKL